jgi:hypothetical protein
MDLETLLTTVYVLVSDWYKEEIEKHKPKRPGPEPRMTDSEVLTLAIVGQWQVGVPWRSERGLVRWANSPEGKRMFPKMLGRSRYNLRVRELYGVLVRLQQDIAEQLTTLEDIYECVDCEPLPAFSNSQALRDKAHWLFESTKGHGGTSGGFFYGDHLLVSGLPSGAVTGWLLATAYIQDRWLLEALLSGRAGQFELHQPPPNLHEVKRRRPVLPIGFIGPPSAVGHDHRRPYLADKGFNGDRWRIHWKQRYGASVITVPPANVPNTWSAAHKRWLASHRQIVDTIFSRLDTVFGMKHLNAHSRWGQLTRIAAKLAAYNIGLYINRLLNRPAGALATLIC